MQNPFLSLPAVARDRVAGRDPRAQPNGYAMPQQAPRWDASCGQGLPADCVNLMGFLDAAVATATQSTITEVAQSDGVADQLVVTDAAENTFQLDDILVARKSQLDTTPMSLCSFKSDQTMKCIRTAQPFKSGLNVSVVVTNFSGGAARFSSNLYYRPVA